MKKIVWLILVMALITAMILVRVNYFHYGINNYLGWFFVIYTLAVLISTAYSFIISETYKSNLRDTNKTVSIVIPVFNEERWIGKTINHCLNQDYDKIVEIIIVNDGSTDNTLKELELFRGNEKVKIISYSPNKGKRVAFMTGVECAKGDLITLIDSDSFLDKNAIRMLALSFGNNPAAVVGHADVYPLVNNLVERMQQVEYFNGFKMGKSAESVFGTVSCMSGCICAYRKEILLDLKQDFLTQKFLGHEPIGEDRALTTMLLKRGYRTEFQPEAHCETIVPSTFKKLIKQRMRWKKAWIREELLQSPIFLKRGIVPALGYFTSMFIGFTLPLVIIQYLVVVPITGNPLSAPLFTTGCVAMGGMMSAYYLWNTEKGDAWSNLLTWFLNILILVWLTPYAALTITKSNWGTR